MKYRAERINRRTLAVLIGASPVVLAGAAAILHSFFNLTKWIFA
jgi:hypothetical protein